MYVPVRRGDSPRGRGPDSAPKPGGCAIRRPGWKLQLLGAYADQPRAARGRPGRGSSDLGRVAHRSEMLPKMAGADVFVFPSLVRGVGRRSPTRPGLRVAERGYTGIGLKWSATGSNRLRRAPSRDVEVDRPAPMEGLGTDLELRASMAISASARGEAFDWPRYHLRALPRRLPNLEPPACSKSRLSLRRLESEGHLEARSSIGGPAGSSDAGGVLREPRFRISEAWGFDGRGHLGLRGRRRSWRALFVVQVTDEEVRTRSPRSGCSSLVTSPDLVHGSGHLLSRLGDPGPGRRARDRGELSRVLGGTGLDAPRLHWFGPVVKSMARFAQAELPSYRLVDCTHSKLLCPSALHSLGPDLQG